MMYQFVNLHVTRNLFMQSVTVMSESKFSGSQQKIFPSPGSVSVVFYMCYLVRQF